MMASESDQMQRDLFQQFYVRVAPLLRGYIYRVCGDQALGDDIFQESFLKFLRTVRWNAPDRQQKAFIFKIAARLIIDNIRRIRPHPLDAAARTEDPESAAVSLHEGLEPDIKSLFDALKPRDRSLLWLAYVEGYSHEEIAGMMGLNAKSIKVLLFRLRESFAASLRGKGYGLEEQS
jgi:RNA polymerase sigma-70 factor (ECF subfamily)